MARYSRHTGSARDVVIAFMPGIQHGFPFLILQRDVSAKVLFHIDAAAIACFYSDRRCYRAA